MIYLNKKYFHLAINAFSKICLKRDEDYSC